MDKAVNTLRAKFIKDIKKWAKTKKSLKARGVKAVSLVILTKKSNGVNIVLGRESSGAKKGLLNMFGGKNDHGSLWRSLFDETYEELGLILNAQAFINAYRAHYYLTSRGRALIFALQIDNIKPSLYLKMMKKRAKAPVQYREMDSIRNIPVKKLQKAKVTNYVKAVLKFIQKQSKRISKKGIRVSLKDFKSPKTKYSTLV